MSISSLKHCFLILLATIAGVTTLQAQLVFENDFDHHDFSGRYRSSMLDLDFNFPEWNSGVDQKRVKITDGYHAYGGSGSSLEVKYPKKKYGTKSTGAQWVTPLPEVYEEAYLSYSVKFKSGFDFVKGGKLPGLAGGTVPSGNTQATGYNGWTGRLMWRTDHTGTPGKPKQKTSGAISYAKFVGSGYDGDGKDEDTTPLVRPNSDPFQFKSNQWYDITQRVKMNDHWTNNGVLQIWIDDELVLSQTDIRFRKTSSLGIDKFFFSTFFGGGWSWRTSNYATAYFDNFAVVAVQ